MPCISSQPDIALWRLTSQVPIHAVTVHAVPHERMTELKRDVFESICEYSAGGGIRLPAEVLIVSGAQCRFS